jgi:hypothetical protein
MRQAPSRPYGPLGVLQCKASPAIGPMAGPRYPIPKSTLADPGVTGGHIPKRGPDQFAEGVGAKGTEDLRARAEETIGRASSA